MFGPGSFEQIVERLLLVPTVGGVLMQWPVGKLSDKVRRRVVMLAVSVVAAVTCVLGVVVDADSGETFAVKLRFPY